MGGKSSKVTLPSCIAYEVHLRGKGGKEGKYFVPRGGGGEEDAWGRLHFGGGGWFVSHNAYKRS